MFVDDEWGETPHGGKMAPPTEQINQIKSNQISVPYLGAESVEKTEKGRHGDSSGAEEEGSQDFFAPRILLCPAMAQLDVSY